MGTAVEWAPARQAEALCFQETRAIEDRIRGRANRGGRRVGPASGNRPSEIRTREDLGRPH
eukprot:11176599-Lingulodinium_polyedra.AAC.1